MSDEDVVIQREPGAREGEHVAPAYMLGAFHCPHCGVLAKQDWTQLVYPAGYGSLIWLSSCTNVECRKDVFWFQTSQSNPLAGGRATARIIEPVMGGGPRPHPDMPEDVMKDYDEARRIVAASPRGACALLRLALQKLMVDLGQPGRNINDDIKALVTNGLPVEVQQALDVLRIVGNNAVHPGEIDLDDDVETASGLFQLLNFIVQDRISQPKKIKAMFDALPQKARDAVAKRDGQTPTT